MKNLLKYTIWAGLYAILFVPFIVADTMFFPYIVGKAFTFRIIVEIIFGLWLILIIKDREFRPKFSWLATSLSLFIFVLLLADIQAVAPFKAFWSNFERMEGWVTMIHLLVYFLVLGSMFNTKERWLWFLRANVAVGLVMAITSLAEGAKAEIVRVAGPLGNPIYISIYFFFIFFFTLILWYQDVLVRRLTNWPDFKKVFANILFYVYPLIAALSFYVVYRTSRGVLLGALGGLFVTAILIALFEKERKVIRHISLGIIVMMVAIIVLFLASKDTEFVKNNPTLSRFSGLSWSSLNGQARQLVWPMAIKGFKEKPILGWGQDGFNYVFNKYYDPRMYNQEQWFDRAHNAPLDALVAGGLLGLLSYLFIFGAALYTLWFKKNNFDVPTRSIFAGILAGYFFQALFVFDTLMSYIMFVTVLAYIHSLLVAEKPAMAFPTFLKNEEYQNYILIPIIVILIGVSVYWINIPALSANRTLIQALRTIQMGQIDSSLELFKKALSYESLADSEIREQLLSYAGAVTQMEQVDSQTKQAFANFAVEEIKKQIATVPDDARYYFLMTVFLNSTANYEAALPYVQKAVELSPNKQTMRFELVRTLRGLGRNDEAIAEAKAAYDLEPAYDQAKALYEALLGEKKGQMAKSLLF